MNRKEKGSSIKLEGKLQELDEKLGYVFKNKKLLETATFHKSYAYQIDRESNERLEFLGDSILEYVMTEHLYNLLSNENEGNLTKIRSYIVCEESLYNIASNLNFEKYMNISKAQENSSGKSKAILADMVEAVIAAIFLDSDIFTAKQFIISNFKKIIEYAINTDNLKDYKTTFQELAGKFGINKIYYVLLEESGPDHEKKFVFELNAIVKGKNKKFGIGTGGSKKEAQMEAAKKGLEELEKYEENIKDYSSK